MKALVGLFVLGLWLLLICSTIYGIVLGFKASILVGIIILIVEPAPLIVGLVALFSNVDLAQKLADLIFN
jgi:hypothetical protein